MPYSSIDCSHLIDGTRIFGTLEFLGTDPATATPTYAGDLEQCRDCGGDDFDVAKDGANQMATGAGWKLVCRQCATEYPLRSEE